LCCLCTSIKEELIRSFIILNVVYDCRVRRFKTNRSSNQIQLMWRGHFWPKFRLKRMLGSKASPLSLAYICKFKVTIIRSFIVLNVVYDYLVRQFKTNGSSNSIWVMWRGHFWPKFRLKRVLGSKVSPLSLAYIYKFKVTIIRSFIVLNVVYDYRVRRFKTNWSSNWIQWMWRGHFWPKFRLKRMLGSKVSPHSLACHAMKAVV
jgi:mannosyltransferase OCH1-like enzyme